MQPKQLTKEYTIDLDLPEKERWSQVIHCEKAEAKGLIYGASREFFNADPDDQPAIRAGMKIFAGIYGITGGHYRGELRAWAVATGASSDLLTFLNCQYELSQLDERANVMKDSLPGWLRNVCRLGCTAGAFRLGDGRLLHVRNMDWPLEAMGRLSRIFRFKKGDREFVTIGVPGMVGVLSGMLPGAYSVTINYAPPGRKPAFKFGPLFLLRNVFETFDTYEDACYALSHTRLSSSVHFTVCSAHGKACVIERTQNDFSRRNLRGESLTVANHYCSQRFSHHNDLWDPEVLVDSCDRSSILGEWMNQCGSRISLENAASILDYSPVLNELTRQQMIFDPARGDFIAWSR